MRYLLKKIISKLTLNKLYSSDLLEETIRHSGLFDESFYKKAYSPSVLFKNPIVHYIAIGANKGFDPSPFFSTSFYLSEHQDIKDSKLNPLYHYIIAGEAEGRKPSVYFSPIDYRNLHADLHDYADNLLHHYMAHGFYEYKQAVGQNHSVAVEQTYLDKRLALESNLYQNAQAEIQQFALTPKISILMPTYNTDTELLTACINSVIAQSYPNWELCIADDCSTDESVIATLKAFETKDKRIKVVYCKENGHISAASNSALILATGEWTALLDHDDLLHEHALFSVVKHLNQYPEAELFYSDEDKCDVDGNRFEPHFKSDWNLDLLYSQNFVSHLGVYKTQIVKKIGGFRVGYEGSQDYDLLLRYSSVIEHSNIIHIPEVLYHWRVVEGSTALDSGEKSYTTDAGILALEDHFKALKQDVSVAQGMSSNTYRVQWNMEIEPLVSLIIPTYNGYEITKQAIDSILNKTSYQNFEIILVDNNSDDLQALAYFDEIAQHEQVTVIRYPHPFNYSAINNFAVKYAKGEIIGLINNDIEVINADWLTEMASQALRDDVGCVGAMLYYPNDTIQHAGVICGLGGVAGHSHKYFPKDHPGYFKRLQLVQNLSAVTAACLLVKKTVFDEVGGLNELDLTVAFNDVDFCLRVKEQGYRNLWTPYAELYHHESISRGSEDNPEKVARFNREMKYMKQKWGKELSHDPFYNENLTLDREDFSEK